MFDDEFSAFDDDESITYRESSSDVSALTYELISPIVLNKLGVLNLNIFYNCFVYRIN